MKRIAAVLSLGVLMLWSAPVQAELYSIDLSSLGGAGFWLYGALYSNSWDPDGSWIMMDNVVCGPDADYFGNEDLGGFDDFLNPDSVKGVWDVSADSYVLKIAEDQWASPTIVLREFTSSSGGWLSFDLEMRPSLTTGIFDDEFVISLLDSSFNPLFIGLTPGLLGDILVANAAGGVQVDEHPMVVPAPAALLLGLLGFGAGGLGLWRGRTHLV